MSKENEIPSKASSILLLTRGLVGMAGLGLAGAAVFDAINHINTLTLPRAIIEGVAFVIGLAFIRAYRSIRESEESNKT